MEMTFRSIIFTLLFFTLFSCSLEKKPINYGEDVCDNCRMTIVDKKFSSEIINTKGKVFKFDAIECMIRFINNHDKINRDDIASMYVGNFDNPGELIKAEKSMYLISKNIPSPMGGFLSAFDNKENAEHFRDKYGGNIFDWKEIINKFMPEK